VDEDQGGDQLIERVQQATASACARWLGHKATQGLVEARRRDVLDRLWPMIQPLVCGDEHWSATFALASCAGLTRGDMTLDWPSIALSDGTIDRPVNRWIEALDAQDPRLARRALDLVVEMAWVARDLAQRLQDAGVPILPDEPSDLAPLVLLLLLNPEQLDWAHPELLARVLTFFPGFGFLASGSAIIYGDRLASSVRQRGDADRLRQDFYERQPGRDVLRNRGGRPQGSATKGSVAQKLAQVLPQVLERFPAASAAELREWTGNGDTPGLMLRRLMDKGPGDLPPSASTLQRMLKKTRDQ
jgi:hypothetical protein